MSLIDDDAILSGAIPNSGSQGLLSLGPGPWDGISTGHFVGSSLGTLLAGAVPSSFGGNLLDLQAGGASTFRVDSGGNAWQQTPSGILVKTPRFVEVSQQLLASTVSQSVFIADDNYQVVGVQAVPNVVGGAGATVNVEVCTGTQAPGAGTAQLTAALALTGTANAVVAGTVVAPPATIAAGQRVGIVMAGTLTGLVGVVTIQLQRV